MREDYDRFQKIERPMIVKSVEYSLKGAQFQLDYEQDELDQLEKMYEADDLTEDTEEVVLKRSKNSVDFAKFNLEQTKQFCDEILNIRLPRFDIDIKESLAKANLTLAQAKTALAIDDDANRFKRALRVSSCHFEACDGPEPGKRLPVPLQGLKHGFGRHRGKRHLRFFGETGEQKRNDNEADESRGLHFLLFFLGGTSFSSSSASPNPMALNRSFRFRLPGSSSRDLSHCSRALSFWDSFR